jgi:thioredoxin 1
MKEINDSNFSIIKDGFSIVEFSATWCGPCRQYKRVLEEYEKENNVVIYTADIDQTQVNAINLHIQNVPTTQCWNNGELIAETYGAKTLIQLDKFIKDTKVLINESKR